MRIVTTALLAWPARVLGASEAPAMAAPASATGDGGHAARALAGRGLRPGDEGAFGGVNGCLDLGERGFREIDDEFAGLGVQDLFVRLCAGFELGADQHLGVHVVLPFIRLQLRDRR